MLLWTCPANLKLEGTRVQLSEAAPPALVNSNNEEYNFGRFSPHFRVIFGGAVRVGAILSNTILGSELIGVLVISDFDVLRTWIVHSLKTDKWLSIGSPFTRIVLPADVASVPNWMVPPVMDFEPLPY